MLNKFSRAQSNGAPIIRDARPREISTFGGDWVACARSVAERAQGEGKRWCARGAASAHKGRESAGKGLRAAAMKGKGVARASRGDE